jgi:FkbM family methyltransferase
MTRFAKDSRLVFDLGLNNGDDTEFYLKRGFDVIALEANPALCERAQHRFHGAIGDGRLKILNVAVWDRSGHTSFYVNLDNDHWSSLDATWAARDSSRCREITIESETLGGLFAEFGVPHYLKVDVEGVDQSVLEQLRDCELLPLFVSVEDCRLGFDYMRILASCGYNAFQLLDQSSVPKMVDKATGHVFPPGSSGPFGNDLPGVWLPHDAMTEHYFSTVRDRSGNRLAARSHWWDIHCTNMSIAPRRHASPVEQPTAQ